MPTFPQAPYVDPRDMTQRDLIRTTLSRIWPSPPTPRQTLAKVAAAGGVLGSGLTQPGPEWGRNA